jgi:hypothetical protein
MFKLFLIALIILIIFYTKINIKLLCDIKNEEILVFLNIKYLFIKINKKIYPQNKKSKNSKKENQKKGNNNINIKTTQIKKIYKLIRKIETYELYSKIEFGTKHIYLTSFIYVLLNSIYGFFMNFFDFEKIYLSVTPDFTKEFTSGEIKIHIKPKIKDLVCIGIEFIKIILDKGRYKK